jgi:hypothetical protein
MKASRRKPARPFDRELRRLLAKHVKGLTVDQKKIQKHVIRPQNIVGIFSDRGLQITKLPTYPINRFPSWVIGLSRNENEMLVNSWRRALSGRRPCNPAQLCPGIPVDIGPSARIRAWPGN